MKENNAAQAVEQDPINAAILLLTEEADSISDCHTRTPGDWAGEPEAKDHYDHVRSVVDALSQLRAPVADERALDLLDTLFTAYESGTPCYEEPDSQGGYLGMAFRIDDDTFRACADLLNKHRPRAALASAPVPVLKDWRIDTSAGGPILVYKDCSVIESAQAEYVLRLIAADQASAPVAEEAKVQIEYLDMDNHRLRRALQKLMARLTDLLDEDQFANCESIVTAAGVEPPASAPVAGEAQIIGYVPSLYLEMRRRGMPVNSKIQHSPGDDATAPLYAASQARPSDDELWDQTLTERDEYHDIADKLANAIADHLLVEIGEHSSGNCPWMRALEAIENAAPQASAMDAEYTRGRADGFDAGHSAALEKAAQALDRLHAENRRWHNEFRDAAAVVRALKTQADKDGGQQREGVVTDDMRYAVRFAPSSAHWSERLVEFFGPDAREGIDALERQLREARAALSAPQAEQGERDAD
ncbi:hypothetical protein [Achromobacter xylosoxidans]|uniref:hypothetical protein n=1 Tax=Alcaligenes xylosoxydans xylosoxydans TaxID=85698 RepID=UPI0006AC0E11|nr:hypothetical protein [Achromobacter xylosoxidans]